MRFDYRHTRCYEIVWIFQFKAFKSCWTHNNNWCAIFDSLRKIMLGKFGILPVQNIHCHTDPSVAVPSIVSTRAKWHKSNCWKKNNSVFDCALNQCFPHFCFGQSVCWLLLLFFYFHSCPFRFHNILCDLKCIYLFIFSYIFIETERRSFCFRWFRNISPRRTYAQRTHTHTQIHHYGISLCYRSWWIYVTHRESFYFIHRIISRSQ